MTNFNCKCVTLTNNTKKEKDANSELITDARKVRDYIIAEQKIVNVATCIHYKNSKEKNSKKKELKNRCYQWPQDTIIVLQITRACVRAWEHAIDLKNTLKSWDKM